LEREVHFFVAVDAEQEVDAGAHWENLGRLANIGIQGLIRGAQVVQGLELVLQTVVDALGVEDAIHAAHIGLQVHANDADAVLQGKTANECATMKSRTHG